MPRRLRFSPPGYWLHLTQRGNNKQPVFSTDADRQRFLGLVEQHSEERDVRVTAYTLMSNHFHSVAVGDRQDAISHFMREVNGQYATYRNATQRTTGRVWQNRFYSCVLDDSHWETALRYVELNPVRARLAQTAEDYRWSSARAHLSLETPLEWLDLDQFLRRWPTPASWRDSLATLTRREVAAVRRATRHDSALGSDEFLQNLERTLQGDRGQTRSLPGFPLSRRFTMPSLRPSKGGRPSPPPIHFTTGPRPGHPRKVVRFPPSPDTP